MASPYSEKPRGSSLDIFNDALEFIVVFGYPQPLRKSVDLSVNAWYEHLSDFNMETILTLETTKSADTLHSENDAGKRLSDLILRVLDEHSAQDTIQIDIRGKSSVADYMIVTSGRSNRHVGALADYVLNEARENGHQRLGVEGQDSNDWVLVDYGDVILHIFRPEVRVFYNLEKIWSVPLPEHLRGSEDEELA